MPLSGSHNVDREVDATPHTGSYSSMPPFQVSVAILLDKFVMASSQANILPLRLIVQIYFCVNPCMDLGV